MKVSKARLREAVARVAEDLITDGPLTTYPVVGLKEINRMFGYASNTAYQMRSRGVLPESSPISNNPVWKLVTLYEFAERTNREIFWDPWGVCAPSGETLASAEDAAAE
ncbi:hypothetical protein [Actinoplanes sp. NPDC049316]|uniref:hypothetical protein n=1 Tax=Actinoplanes sp. NPDC049316 TaxID=3154727 RepID=UPI00343AA354